MERQSRDAAYGIFLKTLEDFQAFLASPSASSGAIAEKFTEIELMYREKILILTEEKSDRTASENHSLWQSLQTETHKTLRLLQTDIIFLQASRQAATIQQRKAACLSKVDRLIGYCQQLRKN